MNALLVAIGFLACDILYAQVAPVEEALWQSFISWAKNTPAEDLSYKAVLERFRSHLTTSGTTATEADRRIDALAKLLEHAHTGGLPQQQEWDLFLTDKYYAGRPTGHTYPFPPNSFLASVIKDLPAGTALDCGMGSGRDSIYLAQKGWTAVGFDRSGGAVALASENAHKAGVKIEAVAASAANFNWGTERFDLISNIHSMGVQDSLVQIHTSLKTGGIYVVELLMLPELKDRARMPAAYLPNEPLTFFREGWRIIRYEDVPGSADCAGCRQTKMRVLRLVAQKINASDWR